MDYRLIIIYLLLYYYIDSCSSECIALYSEGLLREKLGLVETTRMFTLWYDHAVLLKRGYIMFKISPNYLPQLYHFTEHYVRTLHTDNYYFSYRVAAAVALKRSVEALVSLDFDSAEI